MARLSETQGNKILILVLILTLVSIAGASRLRVENSFINYFKEDTEIYQGLKLVDKKLGGTTTLEVRIKFKDATEEILKPEDLVGMTEDEIQLEREYAEALANSPEYWFTITKVQRIKELHDYLDALPEIGKVLSLASSVRVAEALTEQELDAMELAILYTKFPIEMRESLIDPYISIEENEARVFARMLDSHADLRRNELIETVRLGLEEKLGFEKRDVTVSGLIVLGQVRFLLDKFA